MERPGPRRYSYGVTLCHQKAGPDRPCSGSIISALSFTLVLSSRRDTSLEMASPQVNATQIAVDDTDPALHYSTIGWQPGGVPQEYKGTTHGASSDGASVSYTFSGTLNVYHSEFLPDRECRDLHLGVWHHGRRFMLHAVHLRRPQPHIVDANHVLQHPERTVLHCKWP
jgi:hypothetical protein